MILLTEVRGSLVKMDANNLLSRISVKRNIKVYVHIRIKSKMYLTQSVNYMIKLYNSCDYLVSLDITVTPTQVVLRSALNMFWALLYVT